jgi:hypothetical protein
MRTLMLCETRETGKGGRLGRGHRFLCANLEVLQRYKSSEKCGRLRNLCKVFNAAPLGALSAKSGLFLEIRIPIVNDGERWHLVLVHQGVEQKLSSILRHRVREDIL